MSKLDREKSNLVYILDELIEFIDRDKINEHVKELWAKGEKLEAIKYYKFAKDRGLKEAKDEVEELCKNVEYGSTALDLF